MLIRGSAGIADAASASPARQHRCVVCRQFNREDFLAFEPCSGASCRGNSSLALDLVEGTTHAEAQALAAHINLYLRVASANIR